MRVCSTEYTGIRVVNPLFNGHNSQKRCPCTSIQGPSSFLVRDAYGVIIREGECRKIIAHAVGTQ